MDGGNKSNAAPPSTRASLHGLPGGFFYFHTCEQLGCLPMATPSPGAARLKAGLAQHGLTEARSPEVWFKVDGAAGAGICGGRGTGPNG